MMVKVLLLAALATVLVSAEDDWRNIAIYGPFEIIDFPKFWNIYKTAHNKSYSGAEDQMRMEIFKKSTKSVVDFNLNSIANLEVPVYGINPFSDWTAEEYKKLLGNESPNTTKAGVTN